MKLEIGDDECHIRGDVELPSNFDSMRNDEKWDYISKNRLLHREEGPAEITPSGTKLWYLNGLRHKIDGPAIFSSFGYQEWCLNDIRVGGETYKKIQNSSKEELLVYMVNPKYKDYLPLIEYRLSLWKLN